MGVVVVLKVGKGGGCRRGRWKEEKEQEEEGDWR